MFAQKLVLCLLAILLALLLSGGQLLAARGRPCTWGDAVYAHGSVRYAPISFQGTIVRFNIFRCQDASWAYIGSADDVMP